MTAAGLLDGVGLPQGMLVVSIVGELLPTDQFLPESPDFFALIDGKRRETGQLKWCLSNDALIDTVADAVIRMVRENPDSETVQLWPDDGNEPACEVDIDAATKALGRCARPRARPTNRGPFPILAASAGSSGSTPSVTKGPFSSRARTG